MVNFPSVLSIPQLTKNLLLLKPGWLWIYLPKQFLLWLRHQIASIILTFTFLFFGEERKMIKPSLTSEGSISESSEETLRKSKPSWLKVKLPIGENYRKVRELVDDHK